MSNNKVRDWAEIDKLAALEQLKVWHTAAMHLACNRTVLLHNLRLQRFSIHTVTLFGEAAGAPASEQPLPSGVCKGGSRQEHGNGGVQNAGELLKMAWWALGPWHSVVAPLQGSHADNRSPLTAPGHQATTTAQETRRHASGGRGMGGGHRKDSSAAQASRGIALLLPL